MNDAAATIQRFDSENTIQRLTSENAITNSENAITNSENAIQRLTSENSIQRLTSENSIQRLTSENSIQRLNSENATLLARLEAVELERSDSLLLHLHSLKSERNVVLQQVALLQSARLSRATHFEEKLLTLRDSFNASPLVRAKLLVNSTNQQQVKDVVDSLLLHIDQQEIALTQLALDLDLQTIENTELTSDNKRLKISAVECQQRAEQEEEFISNKLLRRINTLKLEKADLLSKVEQEEEMITNTLQRKLTQLQKEKCLMEQNLEQEQEFIVNRLQKQLEQLKGSAYPSNLTSPMRSSFHGSFTDIPATSQLDLLKSEVPPLLC